MPEKIMIVGPGRVGTCLLGYLAKTPDIPEVIIVGRDGEKGLSRVNIERIGAGLVGLYPHLRFIQGNVENPTFIELLQKEKPTLIINAACKYDRHNFCQSLKSLKFCHGTSIIFALQLSYSVAKAITTSGIKTRLINISYPDGVCPVLWAMRKVERPWMGAGGIHHIIPRIQLAVSKLIQCNMKEVEVYLVAGHPTYSLSSTPPSYLKVSVNGEDITELLGGQHNIYSRAALLSDIDGARYAIMTASSTYMMIMQIIHNRGELMHAPGPLGLLGGYPVRIWNDRVEISLPKSLSIEEAQIINKANMHYDGIEKIDAEGNIIFTDHNYQILKDKIGFNCKTLKADYDEWVNLGNELSLKIQEKILSYAPYT